MPSALGQNVFTMEKKKVAGESCTFICTVCGDGFSQYTNVLTHMSVHGPLESFTFDGSSNGFEVPREYVLQENGTLTVLNSLTQTLYSTTRPSSPGVLPSRLSCPVNPASSSPKPQFLSKDVLRPKALDSNLDNSHQGLYHCEVCSRPFNSLRSLHSHQQYRNTESGYRCTLCCKFFVGRQEFKKHLQNHTFERFHGCARCGKRFIKAHALNVHMKQSHLSKSFGVSESNQDIKLERTYTCKKCKLSFFWLTDFQAHSFYQCKGKEVSAVFETEVEIEVTSKVTKDNLETCNGTSTHARNGDIEALIKAGSEIESSLRPYRCGLCGERFHELTALKDHHKTHQTQEEIEKLSQESLKPLKRLIPKGNRRIRNNHLNVKMYPCKLCSRVFNHSSSLSRHMRYHKGTMHTCKFCGRHFQQRCDVTRHVLMFHKAELEKTQTESQALCLDNVTTSPGEQKTARGNYKCHECGKKFGLLCVYQRHLRYHKKECKSPAECTNSFPMHQKPCLDEMSDAHKVAPSGGPVLEKNHTEAIGGNSVHSAPNDEEHLSEEVYKCTECSQTFSCMEIYDQHQASHGSEAKGSYNAKLSLV